MNIHLLPPETMLEIFTKIDFLYAIRTCSLVCRTWRTLCLDQHLWDLIDFTDGDLGRGLNDTVFKKTIELCPRVRSINMCKTHITMRGVEIIVRSCMELSSLDLSSCSRLKCANFDVLLSLPLIRRVNLLGTWKLNESSLHLMDPFLDRGILLGVSLELFPPHTSVPSQLTDSRMERLSKLHWVDIHLNHSVASFLLDHPCLPSFSSSLISMEIGSRCTSSTFPSLSRGIGLLTSLTNLTIVSHDLNSLPSEFSNLKNLKTLNISSCKSSSFTTLPDEITRLPSLTVLNVSANRLAVLPPSISRLTSLTKLCVSNNELAEIPAQIGQLTQLVRLNVSVNKLQTLPAAIGKLRRLERLNCAHNWITSLPRAVFDDMDSILSLDFQSNRLSSVPDTIARPSLVELFLNDNVLDSVPVEVGTELSSLKKLVLHHNRLICLPSDLQSLHQVKYLSLHNNCLEFIPNSIAKMQSLKTLELSSNRLRELPPAMTTLAKLRRIELQNNSFTSLSSLQGINSMTSLKSVQFDSYLQEGHPEKCMCKFCVFARFDEAHFDDIVEGDSEFEAELIILFFKCTEKDFQDMSDALNNNNFHEIYFVSHKIKGALSNMGAVKLANLCSTLEEQARQQSICSCKSVFTTLQMEYGQIKQVLIKRLQKSGHVFIFPEIGFK